MRPFSKLPAYGAGWAAVFLWAAAPVLFKLCALEAPLPYVLVLRFAICCAILLPTLLTLFRERASLPVGNTLRMWFWIGANFYFTGTSLTLLPASVYIIVYSLVPLVSLFVLRLAVRPLQWALAFVAAAGCLLLVENSHATQSVSRFGLAYLVVGMFTWVFFTREFARMQAQVADFKLSALTNLGMFLVSIVWWALIGVPTAPLSPPAWGAILLLGLTSPLAFYLYSFALRHVKVFAILSQYCEPVFGIVLASLLLGESFTPLQWLGAALVMSAVFGSTRSSE